MYVLKVLLLFAMGFFKGFAEEYGAKQPRPLHPSGDTERNSVGAHSTGHRAFVVPARRRGYDFLEEIPALAAAAGIRLQGICPDSAILCSSLRGHSYKTLVSMKDGEIILGTASNYSFPPTQFPEDVHHFMREMNETTLKCCRYVVQEIKGRLCVCAFTQVATSELTLELFQDLIVDMKAAIWALENYMLEARYVH